MIERTELMLATIIAEVSDESADSIASVITWSSFAIGALVSLMYFYRGLFPLRLKESDPWQFAKPYGKYSLRTFTGFADDASKSRSTTVTTLNSQVTHVDTTVRNEFTLTDGNRQVMAVQANNFDALIGFGHVVSVGWVVWKKADRGEYLFVINHTTGLTYNNGWKALRAVQSGEAPKGHGGLHKAAWLVGLVGVVIFIPLTIVARFVHSQRGDTFKSRGLRPIEHALNDRRSQMLAYVTAQLAARSAAAAPPPPSPAAPPPPPAAAVPAGWFVDPHGRHEHRWWDGTRWTDQVSTGGLRALDPA
jgi:Protein of unknown function (DUF2510)